MTIQSNKEIQIELSNSDLSNQHYQLGNYVSFKDNIVKIDNLDTNADIIRVIDKNGEVYETAFSNLSPIKLTEETFAKMGYEPSTKEEKTMHTKLIYNIIINGKMYYIQGHVFKTGSIWNWNTITFHYFHQLQNLLSVIEPRYRLKMF